METEFYQVAIPWATAPLYNLDMGPFQTLDETQDERGKYSGKVHPIGSHLSHLNLFYSLAVDVCFAETTGCCFLYAAQSLSV